MEAELNKADKALDDWMVKQALSDKAATKHKHHTAAQVVVLSKDGGVTKAKEAVYSTDEWLKRELYCNDAAIEAQRAKQEYEQAIRRWEMARSEFSAGRRVK